MDTDGAWASFHVTFSALVILVCYFAVNLASSLTIRIVNWFLLRSFADVSRKWCFVLPPHKKTKLERSQFYMKLAFGILALLMHWPGWQDCSPKLWQCFLRAAFYFVAVEFALVLSIVFVEAFVRTGHYLALNLGWTPEPVPWWDYGLEDTDASHAPGPPRACPAYHISEQQCQPDTDTTANSDQSVKVLYAGYGNSFRQSQAGTDMAGLLRSSRLSNTAFPMTPDTAGNAGLLRSSRSNSQRHVDPSLDPLSANKSRSATEQLIDFGHTPTGPDDFVTKTENFLHSVMEAVTGKGVHHRYT